MNPIKTLTLLAALSITLAAMPAGSTASNKYATVMITKAICTAGEQQAGSLVSAGLCCLRNCRDEARYQLWSLSHFYEYGPFCLPVRY